MQDEWDQDRVVDSRQLFEKISKARWWILLSVVCCAAIAAFIAWRMPPVYRASTVLVSTDAERGGLSASLNSALGQLGGLASLATVNVGGSSSEMQEALAVMTSRQFTEAFIDDLELLPVFFPQGWDAVGKQWRQGYPRPTMGKAYRYFDTQVRAISQDRKTGLITLRIDWRDRTVAAAWANLLVERLNREMRARAMRKASTSIEYLEKEVAVTPVVATRDALNRLIEAQIRQRMLATVTQEYTFRVVDKAVAPDPEDTVRPRRMVIVVAGGVAGLMLGVFGAVLFGFVFRTMGRRARSEPH